MNVDSHDVYRDFVNLKTTLLHSPQEKVSGPPPFNPAERLRCTRRCIECSCTDLRVDQHEAVEVCEGCGLIQHRGNLSTVDEFQKLPETAVNATQVDVEHGSASTCPLVQRLLRSTETRLPNGPFGPLWNLLVHWNVYVRVNVDDLKQLHCKALTWTSAETTTPSRIAAILLFLPLERMLPSEGEVRSNLRCRKTLTTLETTIPQGQFACSQCGTNQHTLKAARMHCRIRRHVENLGERVERFKQRRMM